MDELCEHVADVATAYRKLVPYGHSLGDAEVNAATATWLTTPSLPTLPDRGERQLRWFLDFVSRTHPRPLLEKNTPPREKFSVPACARRVPRSRLLHNQRPLKKQS